MIDISPQSITVLVNKKHFLPNNYIPDDLTIPNIPFSFAGEHEKKQLRKEASDALEALFSSAKKDNINLYAVSGYRSYNRQKSIYDENVEKDGKEATDLYSAKPGCSEHQTGLSMDVSSLSIHNRLDPEFAATIEGKWLKHHAHEYGFIIRYPKNKTKITGYTYEPWHIRYMGEKLANILYEKELTFEEYLENEQG